MREICIFAWVFGTGMFCAYVAQQMFYDREQHLTWRKRQSLQDQIDEIGKKTIEFQMQFQEEQLKQIKEKTNEA